ncbi:MAG: hypothetical protein ABJ242_07325 [Marinomonas sp.]
MATSHQDRWLVLAGIAAAWLASIVFIYFGAAPFASTVFPADSTAFEALAFALLLGVLPLFAGIGNAARLRHFTSNIDGSAPVSGSALDVTLRFVTNTAEQLILFSIASFGAATFAPTEAAICLPVMGLWFVIARTAFFIGYRITPLARAFGFAATFHPIIALGGYALFSALA